MSECPIIDACNLTPSREFYRYRCLCHYNQCEAYQRFHRLELNLGEDLTYRLDSIDEMNEVRIER